jgi:hypothetical protein
MNAPRNATVRVTTPLITASLGFVRVAGLWRDPLDPARTRWAPTGLQPISWSRLEGTYVAWDPIEPGRT